MDPNACLEQIRQYIMDGDMDAANQAAAEDLRGWLEKGGFQPELPTEIRSYLETALWSSIDASEEPIDKNYGINNISPEFLCQSIVDVFRFLWENRTLIQGKYTGRNSSEWSDDEMAAHDFCLTRNHHGAGFWDGDWETGDELTKVSHKYPEVDLHVGDDGKIYC